MQIPVSRVTLESFWFSDQPWPIATSVILRKVIVIDKTRKCKWVYGRLVVPLALRIIDGILTSRRFEEFNLK